MKNQIAGLMCCLLLSVTAPATAHNGMSALAYPVKNIRVDGDLSEWKNVKRLVLAKALSDDKPKSAEDLSAFFWIGYNLSEQALYLAIEVNDNEYLSDTTKQVSWNTQDAVQLYLDVRHQVEGSGVTAFLFSETYKYVNTNAQDAAWGLKDWERVEVNMKRNGAKRTYEWKIMLGDVIQPGASIGLDMLIFDKDAEGFGWLGWGSGENKYQNAASLGDVVLMKENAKAGMVTGQLALNAGQERVSVPLKYMSVASPRTWVMVQADSLGKYAVSLPEGEYTVSLTEKYLPKDHHVYMVSAQPVAPVRVKANGSVNVPTVKVTIAIAPDLIPAQGVMKSFDSQTPAAIDNFIETYRKYYKIPGVSLALIKDGKVVYHQVYGVKNTNTGEPVNDSTLFEAASITKPVFGYTVQRLAERGVIDLDRPLYLYLPFKDIEYDDRYKLITARHVLSHRTGFPNWRNGKLTINFTPGTQYGYSGEGMQYLQAVIEKITGKGIEQVLREEVLDPLGMHHTFFSNNPRLMRLVATGHFSNVPSTDLPPANPGMAYSMHTEALEFTKFMFQLLNQKGLSAATYTNMLSERSVYPVENGEPAPKYKAYMGESLSARESPFGLVFGHGGNNGDFRCQFEVYKDLGIGYAVFTNSGSAYPMLEKMKDFLVEGKQE